MKDNHNKKHHQNNGVSVMDEIKFDLIPECIDVSDLKPVTEYVTLPRYEYDSLVRKVAVYDLLRDLIARSDYISADSVRSLLGIAKREDTKA